MSILTLFTSRSTKNIRKPLLLSPKNELLHKDFVLLNRIEASKTKRKHYVKPINFSALNTFSEQEKKYLFTKKPIFDITEVKKNEIKEKANLLVDKLTDDKVNIYKPIKEKKKIEESIDPTKYIIRNILLCNSDKKDYKSYRQQLMCLGKEEGRKEFIENMQNFYSSRNYHIGKHLFSVNKSTNGERMYKSIEKVIFPKIK